MTRAHLRLSRRDFQAALLSLGTGPEDARMHLAAGVAHEKSILDMFVFRGCGLSGMVRDVLDYSNDFN
jgi:hypothetical protein